MIGLGAIIMSERLQKIIASAGLMSRRAAEECILAGRVTVNGEPARLGCKADAEKDAILIDGAPLPLPGEKIYIMLHKPRGYVTTMSDEKGRRNVTELVRDAGARVYPVGRLDMYSEGLLIMTNDGEFANTLMHPSHNVAKTYHTWVTGERIEEKLALLRQPMEIDGHTTRGAEVELIGVFKNGAQLSVTIREGRNRQVRKMCEQAGLKVTKLCRVSEGGLELGSLACGKWRRLSEEEVRLVQR